MLFRRGSQWEATFCVNPDYSWCYVQAAAVWGWSPDLWLLVQHFLRNHTPSQESFYFLPNITRPLEQTREDQCPRPLVVVKSYVWWGRHFTFPASLLRPGNITDSIHRSGIFFPLKIWPQCLGSSLCTIHSYSVLFCFIFKIKQTSSMTVCQNKEASEHENKNYGPFHLRGESPCLDTSEPLDPGHPNSAFSLADESDVGREGRTQWHSLFVKTSWTIFQTFSVC